jgi:translocation and assembly module TamA
MRVPMLCRFTVIALVLLTDPQSVRAQSAPADPPGEQPLDPESPLAPLPELGVDWPDMAADLPSDPSLRPVELPAPAETTEIEGDRRYRVTLAGIIDGDRETILSRFNMLSTLKDKDDDPANVAQINRRAREDVILLDNLLRAEGYYDATIETEVSGSDPILVTLRVEPGGRYSFQTVDVAGLDTTGPKAADLRRIYGVNPSDPVNAEKVIGGGVALESELKAAGYPFAIIGEPQVVVDHETRTATLNLIVTPGDEQRFGVVRLSGTKPPFGPRHVERISRFKAGQVYDQAKVDDLKRALIATGIISTADVKPVPSGTPGVADIAVALETAPLRTLAAEAGYGTGEGARAEVSWTHRNLIRPEGAVTFRGVAGTQEQYIGAILRQSNFRKRDQILNARVLVQNTTRRAFDARTVEIGAGIERQTNIIWQKKWIWSLGAELVASDERDVRKIVGGGRRTFLIGAFPASLSYDGSNDLLDPTRGFRLSGRVSPEVSIQNGTVGYVRTQIDGSAYLPTGDRITIAGRVRFASIFGASSTRIAPSRRLYSGGGGSVRGYGFQRIGPRDIANDPAGGRSLAEFGLEARVRVGDFGIVPFIDGGNVYASQLPEFSRFRYGAGIGGRYHSSFGPIRIDLATPLNPRAGDPRVTIFVSLGQAF